MSTGIRKAALALANLRKSDQTWILRQLTPEQREPVLAEMRQVLKKKGIHRLSFDDILQLGKSVAPAAPAVAVTVDRKVEAWSALQANEFRQIFAEASDYTLWLLFKWDALPDRTLLSTYLNEHQSRRINQFERSGARPESWLIDTAVDWVLQELSKWKPLA